MPSSLDSCTHVIKFVLTPLVNTLYLFARLSSRLGNSVTEICFFFFLWNLEVIACLAVFVQVDILLCIIIVNRNMLYFSCSHVSTSPGRYEQYMISSIESHYAW